MTLDRAINNALLLDEAAERYAAARQRREEADAAAKALKAVESEAEAVLFDYMEQQNLRSIKHARGTFYLNDQAWATVTDEAKAREWALNEHPEVITLNRSRLSAMVRDWIENGDDIIEGIDYTVSRKVGWRDRR